LGRGGDRLRQSLHDLGGRRRLRHRDAGGRRPRPHPEGLGEAGGRVRRRGGPARQAGDEVRVSAEAMAAEGAERPATVLVTGAAGCLGAWTVKHLLEAGHMPVAFDLATDYRRLRALIGPGALDAVTSVRGDITDRAQV